MGAGRPAVEAAQVVLDLVGDDLVPLAGQYVHHGLGAQTIWEVGVTRGG